MTGLTSAKKRFLQCLVLVLACVAAPCAPCGAADKPLGRVWAGVGLMSGDVTYRIGGHFSSPQGSADYHFPISELQWPLDVPVALAGGEVYLSEQTELSAALTKNLQSAAGKMKDSDWTDTVNPSVKTIYSESDAVLQSFSADMTLRYWFSRPTVPGARPSGIGVGLGWLYERFDWDARNLDQWYPQNSSAPHIIVPGIVGTYYAALSMPYAEIAVRRSVAQGWGLGLSLGISPAAMIEDADDHILRQLYSTTRATGLAGKAALEARYSGPRWFFSITGDVLRYQARAMDHTSVYGGTGQGSEWSIEHEITGMRYRLSAAGGIKF